MRMKIKKRKYLFAVILCSLFFNINAGAHNEDDGIQRFLGYYLLETEPSQLEYTSPAAMSLSFNDEGKLTRFSGLYYSTTGTSKYYDYTSYEISGDTLTCYYNGSYTYYSPNEDTSPGEHQFILTKEGNLVEGEYVWYRYDRDNSSDEKHPGTLMEVKDIDFPEGKYSKNTSFLGNKDLPRKKIKEITFLDSLENEPEDSWDVSFDHDGSVKAWMDTSEGICHVYIASEGRISAPEHSQSLFRHCVNLTKIEFNGVFDTSSAVYMGYMFAGCKKLKYIYGIEDFNTSGVYSFSGMFADDKGLISLDLSSFDTSHAHEMDRIFYNCSRLERLNIPNFSF